MDCVIIGFIVKFMTEKSYAEFQKNAFVNYWVLIDIIVMFLGHAYNYTCRYMTID